MLPSNEEALYRECRAAIESGVAALVDKPEETAEATLAALWHAAARAPLSADAAAASELPALGHDGEERLRELLRRRLAGAPLAHLTGRARFMGLEMMAGPEALIPRRETEILGRAAAERLRALSAGAHAVRAVDVCTGSGNLALALAHHEPRARVLAIDISSEALALARRNCAALGLSGRVEFACGDLLAPLEASLPGGEVDLITCNPPYISTARLATMPAEIAAHEPRLAFDGGPLGIRVVERLVREAPRFLRGGGWLALEVGTGQGRGVRRRIEQHGDYDKVEEACDASGVVRALLARRRTR